MIDGVPGKATEARFFGSCALGPAAGSPGQAGVTRSRAADRHDRPLKLYGAMRGSSKEAA